MKWTMVSWRFMTRSFLALDMDDPVELAIAMVGNGSSPETILKCMAYNTGACSNVDPRPFSGCMVSMHIQHLFDAFFDLGIRLRLALYLYQHILEMKSVIWRYLGEGGCEKGDGYRSEAFGLTEHKGYIKKNDKQVKWEGQ